jgi:Family of unknown function (DUF6152)
MKSTLSRIVVLGALFCGGVFAHHGTSVTYQTDKTITISGTVTEFSFSYPHPQLYLDVKDANGNVQHWGTEWGPTPLMLKNMNVGWSRESIKPGDQVVIVCNPHKLATATACLLKQLTVNGKKMTLGGGGNNKKEE